MDYYRFQLYWRMVAVVIAIVAVGLAGVVAVAGGLVAGFAVVVAAAGDSSDEVRRWYCRQSCKGQLWIRLQNQRLWVELRCCRQITCLSSLSLLAL